MTTQLLLYETVVPLSFGRHRDSSVEIGRNYSFSGKVNSVGWSTQESRSQAPGKSCVISRATPTAWPSPIAAS
jgi:hypothetical protein